MNIRIRQCSSSTSWSARFPGRLSDPICPSASWPTSGCSYRLASTLYRRRNTSSSSRDMQERFGTGEPQFRMLQARKTSIFSACTRKEPAAEPFVALRLPDLAVNHRQRRFSSTNFRNGLPMTPPRPGWDMSQHHPASTSGCPTSVYGAVGTDFHYLQGTTHGYMELTASD